MPDGLSSIPVYDDRGKNVGGIFGDNAEILFFILVFLFLFFNGFNKKC
ncbi:MAG TPA: hypothetical protein GXX49_10385 [Clostridiaceae bacterium]|nr:hypothetical protein [Clostridiaceae bacterium]